MMVEGWGAAVDRLISDFAQGTVEWLVEEGERRGDWVIVEGQGSLDHPAYSSVTLALIHGATPQAMVLVHKAGQTETTSTICRSHLSHRRAPPVHRPARACWLSPQPGRRTPSTRTIPDHDGAGRGRPGSPAPARPVDDPVRSAATAWGDREGGHRLPRSSCAVWLGA
jgi:hypothetical protein